MHHSEPMIPGDVGRRGLTRPSIGAGLRLHAAEWLAVIILLAFAILILVLSAPLASGSRFGPGPGFFAHYLGMALLGLCLVQAVVLAHSIWGPGAGASFARSDREEARSPAPVGSKGWIGQDHLPLLKFAILSGAMFAYAPMLAPFGFLLATSVLSWLLLTLLGRPPVRALVESVVAVVALRYAFTELLNVPLPLAKIGILRSMGL